MTNGTTSPRRRKRHSPAVNTCFLGLKLPERLVSTVDEIAAAENVTRSEIVRRAVEKFSQTEI